MKGIVLSGGLGTRLHPLTKVVSKQLLPVYDKPMIYYPISVLMLAGIRDILVITTPKDHHSYRSLLGDGSQFGVKIQYAQQAKPSGVADAFIVGEKFIGDDNVCLILGDNIFYGLGFTPKLNKAVNAKSGATIFAYQVKDPSGLGIVELDDEGNIISIEEKPEKPKSNYAVTGLYFYDNNVVDLAKSVIPSKRGEIEISSINNFYLKNNNLNVEVLGRGFSWLDTGTHESLLEASVFVENIEKRQGYKIACLEEIAFENNWIDENTLIENVANMTNNNYKKYLEKFFENEPK